MIIEREFSGKNKKREIMSRQRSNELKYLDNFNQ